MGWSVQNTDNEVRLVMPGANVGAILGNEEVQEEAEVSVSRAIAAR